MPRTSPDTAVPASGADSRAAADHFDYREAFSRTLGWITPAEQDVLRSRRVAIAGLGGVGGSHLITLTRLGVGAFHIADFDRFELANFNRQAGARLSTLGRNKLEVLAAAALDINPQLDLKRFPEGVTPDNARAFLDGCDLYVDGLDFFAVEARRAVFAACAELGVPAITAAPLGMGVSLLAFMPGGMTFEDYFQLDGRDQNEQFLRFLVGLSPARLHGAYLVWPRALNLAARRGPSTPMACDLCAGTAASYALKILLRRGPVPAAPWALHFDAYRNRSLRTWRPGGNRHPLQRLALVIGRRALRAAPPPVVEAPPDTPAGRVLDLARWAPSGDNSQPWRFELLGPDRLRVYGRDTRDHCIYDLQGRASQLAWGGLLESIAIAASGEGLRADIRRQDGDASRFDVALKVDARQRRDPLAGWLRQRQTRRGLYSTRDLSAAEREILQAALPAGYELRWFQGWRQRLAFAAMLFGNGGLRLALPEAYGTHSAALDWTLRVSPDRIPARALGLDPLTRRIMGWVMADARRAALAARLPGASLLARLEMDWLPALACGAHFVLLAPTPPASVDERVAAGRAMQRFWLSAARLGLALQPAMTPLIFAEYVRDGVRFTARADLEARARSLVRRCERLIGAEDLARAVFLGRIGGASYTPVRSTRLALQHLLIDTPPP